MIVSSIVGIMSGIPGTALYAATKSFGLHLAQGLAIEMEPMGISVTALCPGATRTKFAAQSNMEDAVIWKLPFLVSNADDVAQQGVQAMFLGVRVYIPGFMNRLLAEVVVPIFPARITMKLCRFFWQPWPLSNTKSRTQDQTEL
mmetsp:Transcript_30282/g.29177  ORF Transcript_30282/g.29177 Transcript_30282/m.29177 type:complete len:144 (-) Transcript_30282:56-487(-)